MACPDAFYTPVFLFSFFVVPVSIRLMKNRAAASVPPNSPPPPPPPSSMSAGAERPGAQSHRRWGGRDVGSASGVPSSLCLSGAQNFHDTGERWHRRALLVI